MSVSTYNPGQDVGCKYSYNRLKSVVYLVSKNHIKNVHIDNGEAYIDGLTELPLRLNGFNIQFTEESSLDERYKFQKKVTLSLNGYVNLSSLAGRYYIILESDDGTFWMVNVDFPSDITYTFNLAQDTNQTDFTFASLSNFPTLKLNAEFEAVSPVCLGYSVHGIDSLQLLEVGYTSLDESAKTVYTYGEDFKDIKFLGKSCSLQEVYDGKKVTTTIKFDISLDSYKTSWHYNLLEFMDNLYAAIIVPSGGDNKYFAGFNFGLQPSFSIASADDKKSSDIITVTLVEMSNHGAVAASEWREEQRTNTQWIYVDNVNGLVCYECIGLGLARYLVKQEVNAKGYTTGNYQVLEGYESQFSNSLNVVSAFTTTETFSNPMCGYDGGQCNMETDIPSAIVYSAQTCYTYTVKSSCPWTISNLPSYLTATPANGAANTEYSVEICNTREVTSNIHGYFNLSYGDYVRTVDVYLTKDESFIIPSNINIDYLAQSVTFTFNNDCPVTFVSGDTGAVVNIGNGIIKVIVPANNSSVTKVWHLTFRNCLNHEQTVTVTQGTPNTQWVDTTDFICIDGNSYIKQVKYIINPDGTSTPTSEYKAGDLITSGDSRCQNAQTRYIWDGNYYCVGGVKYKAMEQQASYDNGTTWVKTGATKLGEPVEDTDHFCDQEVTYEWRISTNYQCGT